MKRKVLALGKAHGFEFSERRGFVGMVKGERRLDVFWWSTPTGPVEFLVVEPDRNYGRRQQIVVRGRDWTDVEQEFARLVKGGE